MKRSIFTAGLLLIGAVALFSSDHKAEAQSMYYHTYPAIGCVAASSNLSGANISQGGIGNVSTVNGLIFFCPLPTQASAVGTVNFYFWNNQGMALGYSILATLCSLGSDGSIVCGSNSLAGSSTPFGTDSFILDNTKFNNNKGEFIEVILGPKANNSANAFYYYEIQESTQ